MIYAVMVHATGSGTAFSLYGLVSGSWCFCLEFPCTWKCGKGAASDKIFAGMIVCIGLLVFCIVEGCVISQMHADGRGGLTI